MDSIRTQFSELLRTSAAADRGAFDAFLSHVKAEELRAEGDAWRRRWWEAPRRTLPAILGRWTTSARSVLALGALLSAVLLPVLWAPLSSYVRESPCLVENNFFVMEMSRPIFDCDICRNLTEVPVETNLSRERFLRLYAYTEVPVLVKNATADWTAMQTFSFRYFQALYREAAERKREREAAALRMAEESGEPPEPGRGGEEFDEGDGLACQFFPYKTEFRSLLEGFNISDDRAANKDGEKPWYFGWSNCDEEIQTELRRHYARPHFLPADSETSSIDWIFMGCTGKGAPMHLDSVNRPSWQAQIAGKKTWDLEPPPECLSECQPMSVTVEQGDIFVINTNVWYHGTFVHPGAISICIGSEYD